MFTVQKKHFELKIIEYTGTDKNVVIPSEIDGIAVTKIDYYAFENNELQSVTIPDSVTYIGSHAFENNQLQSVTIPNSVTKIDYFAFENNQLQSVNYSENTEVRNSAFHRNPIQSINNRTAMCVDGITTFVCNKRTVDNCTLYKMQYLDSDKCYVAQIGEYFAHGCTSRQAIADVKFKQLQATADVDEIVADCRENGCSVMTYRLLTGSCQTGCEQFCDQLGIDYNAVLPVSEVLKLTKGHYGHERFAELLT